MNVCFRPLADVEKIRHNVQKMRLVANIVVAQLRLSGVVRDKYLSELITTKVRGSMAEDGPNEY